MISLARTTSGFTLLELVLVLAVLATAIAVVAPTLGGFASARKAENAARQFVAFTRWARSQAISDGMPYQIVVDTQAGKWWATVEEGEESDAPVEGPFGRVYAVPEEVTLESDLPAVDGLRTITFDPSGRNDVGTVRFVGPKGTIAVACHLPVEGYRILKDSKGTP